MTNCTSLDMAARYLFVRDNSSIASKDRRQYKLFDDMSPGLQQWWRDRAERYAKSGMYGLSVGERLPIDLLNQDKQ